MKAMVAVSALVCAVGLAGSARADAAERVTLKDGSVVAGELVEKVPGRKLVMKLATGEVRTIAWASLLQDPSTTDRTLTAGDVQAPAPQAPFVHAEITADRPGAILERVNLAIARSTWSGAYPAFEPVCALPCSASLASDGAYRVSGPGFRPTVKFGLSPNGSRLSVHTGSAGGRAGGVVLSVLGGLSLFVGIVAATAPLYMTDYESEPTRNYTTKHGQDLLEAGAVAGVAGLVMLVSGIVLYSVSKSSIESEDGQPVIKLGRTDAAPKLRFDGSVAF